MLSGNCSGIFQAMFCDYFLDRCLELLSTHPIGSCSMWNIYSLILQSCLGLRDWTIDTDAIPFYFVLLCNLRNIVMSKACEKGRASTDE